MKIETVLTQIVPCRVSMHMEKPLRAALKLMEAEGVEVLVVTDHCATEGEAVLGLLARSDAEAAVAAQGVAILDSMVSRFVSSRFVVCDKGEYLHDAMKMIERCAASHILVMDRETMVGLVAHRQVQGFARLAAEVN
jgi:signal-transduction protein with cAMP-binding, CBS, and nucleotidyltransferase domain